MDKFVQFVALAGVLGSGVIGGVFFAFSSFVMPALKRLPGKEGIAAMQSINITVIRPSFLGTFMGTALLSLVAVVLAYLRRGEAGSTYLLTAGLLYLLGTFVVTIAGNVPLNDALASSDATDPKTAELWQLYLNRWTLWNHLRTAAALLATLFFCLGLVAIKSGIKVH